MFEFIADTTRILLDLFDAEILNQYPGLRLVIPHSGSCLPVALDRFLGICAAQRKQRSVPLSQLYFDLACDAFPHGTKILLTISDTDHIVYGTDFPAIPVPTLMRHIENARNCPEFVGVEDDILWNNAARLIQL